MITLDRECFHPGVSPKGLQGLTQCLAPCTEREDPLRLGSLGRTSHGEEILVSDPDPLVPWQVLVAPLDHRPFLTVTIAIEIILANAGRR